MNPIQIIALALVGLGLALIVAFVWTAPQIEEIEQDESTVNSAGLFIQGRMIRKFLEIQDEMRQCNTKNGCGKVSDMLEGFKNIWGMNEWYNELYADFLMMDMSIIE